MRAKHFHLEHFAKTASLLFLIELAFGGWNDRSYAGDGTFFKHRNEVAIVLQGAQSATVTVEPAGLVFNDILEYSLTVSNQFPWQPGEQELLGTSLAGGSTILTNVENKGVGFESPWPGDDFYLDPPIEVTEVIGMLGYGRYKITIDELVFYLNTIDGRWNWAYFNQSPTAGDIQFWIREDGVFLQTEQSSQLIQVHQNDEFKTWELFAYNRNRDYTGWSGTGYTWYFSL